MALEQLAAGLQLNPMPSRRTCRDNTIPHAPHRTPMLSDQEKTQALKNALRYFPSHLHRELASEFAAELNEFGHIYMYRFIPDFEIRAYPISEYPCKSIHAAGIMHMIMNNLDKRVAQFPHELVTYGGNGQVFSNWAQFWITMKYLSEMTEEQTLVMCSGHPQGLFPSSRFAPRAVITNGMVIPNYSSKSQYEKMFAMGVTMYGQMTAGSYCYIGPQGIVHGTTLTVMNAGRKYLSTEDLAGTVFLTSGLGGMSGAQAKAAVIAGCVGVIAEMIYSIAVIGRRQNECVHSTNSGVRSIPRMLLPRMILPRMDITENGKYREWAPPRMDITENAIYAMQACYAYEQVVCVHHGVPIFGIDSQIDKTALLKRYDQGWLMHWTDNAEECLEMIRKHKSEKSATSIGFLGSVVDLWEQIAADYEKTGELLVEMGSDQTSCHNPYGGGYYPSGMSLDEAQLCLKNDPDKFKELVQESLRRHVAAINKLSDAGMFFWDYGNAFLLEAGRVGADVFAAGSTTQFRYPSYVQHIMGDIFSLGFGPFRWVCTSGKDEDLQITDRLAAEVIETLIGQNPEAKVLQQYKDNLKWIKEAGKHGLVVGSKARILYSDCKGRVAIASAFNQAVEEGQLSAPIIISRDHHDVSGTDSPYRETSNIYDGSSFCADMAVQNCIGDSFRGATWVALHNGGGVGWGEVINGGFGLVLDGSMDAKRKAEMMLDWDVNNGIARRSWCGNANAISTIRLAMADNSNLKVTLPNAVNEEDLSLG